MMDDGTEAVIETVRDGCGDSAPVANNPSNAVEAFLF